MIKTPYYLISEQKLRENLSVLRSVKEQTGCKILLATKAFAMYSVFPIVAEYLDGVTSSSLHEARLGREEMDKEVHIFSPAYIPDDFDQIVGCCDHIIFNTPAQFERFRPYLKGRSCGIRINPLCSTQDHAIYDPCSPGSRMGTVRDALPLDLEGVDGLHFHTLCEQNSDALKTTLEAVERDFAAWLPRMKWLNMGGGHHITRADYDIATLVECINRVQDKYGLQVYLEPGEAIALDAGWLVSSVLDFNENGLVNCILDTSAACHMPDVIEMPYRPRVVHGAEPNVKPYTYRFGGPTCLAGDIIGDYSFDNPLKVGDQVVFEDMAIYSMVKNNTFNGLNLPSIVLEKMDGSRELIKEFGYEDFKRRL